MKKFFMQRFRVCRNNFIKRKINRTTKAAQGKFIYKNNHRETNSQKQTNLYIYIKSEHNENLDIFVIIISEWFSGCNARIPKKNIYLLLDIFLRNKANFDTFQLREHHHWLKTPPISQISLNSNGVQWIFTYGKRRKSRKNLIFYPNTRYSDRFWSGLQA